MVTAGSRLDWPIGVKNRNQRLCVSEVDFLTQMFGYTARVQRDNESSPEHTRCISFPVEISSKTRVRYRKGAACGWSHSKRSHSTEGSRTRTGSHIWSERHCVGEALHCRIIRRYMDRFWNTHCGDGKGGTTTVCVGGVATAHLSKSDGRILRMFHTCSFSPVGNSLESSLPRSATENASVSGEALPHCPANSW